MFLKVLRFSITYIASLFAFGLLIVLVVSDWRIHFFNLLRQSWETLMRVSSLTTTGFFVIGIAIPAVAATLALLYFRGLKKKPWDESLSESVLPVIFVFIATFLVMSCAYAGAIAKTVYDDHAKLVSEKKAVAAVAEDYKTQLDKLTKPDLRGEIYQAVFARSGDEDQDSIILVTAGIKNFGSPSIAEAFSLRLKLIGGKEIHVIDLPPSSKPLGLELPNGRRAFDVDRRDYLAVKAGEHLIPLGGKAEGWYWGVARGIKVEQTKQEGNMVILSFQDFTGGKKDASFLVNAKEQFEPPDLRKLQRPNKVH